MADQKNESKNLPACAVEFVNRLIKKMRYRRKVREEVRAELTAHFEDELKGCTTDEERQKRAGQLITEFGDLKLLAVLLRRAKKRCRPLWRTVVARMFQVAGVLIVCLVLYGVWFSLGKPTIRVDYVALLNQMNQSRVRDEDNAWPHYKKAFKLFVPQSPLVKQLISYRQSGRDRQDAMRLKTLLRDNQQQVEAWLQANQKRWDSLGTEKQAIVQKCFEYDWVPLPKFAYGTCTEWETTTLDRMTEHVLDCIRRNVEIDISHPRGGMPDSEGPGFPSAELRSWLESRQIPADFARAVSVAVLLEANGRYRNLPEDAIGPLSDIEQEHIGAWVKQNEAAWREFTAGSTKSYCYRPYTTDPNDKNKFPWSVRSPDLSSLRDLARLGMWRSRVDQSQGRVQQSIEDYMAIVRAARQWQGKGTFVEQLAGLAINGLARVGILQILSTQHLSAVELTHLQQQLSQIYSEGFPPINLEGEKLAFMDIVQRSFTDGGPGGGHLIPGTWNDLTDFAPPGRNANERRFFMPLVTAVSMVHPGRDATIAKANEIFDRQDKIAKMTPYQRHAANLKTTDELMQESWQNQRFFLLHILMPATERISEIAYRARMGHEATLTILALKRWRLEKGQYPAALDDLVKAGLLKELPIDPFSDKPLTYNRTDDDFILYSVGQNFIDDGGQYGKDRNGNIREWADNGDTILWPLLKL